VGAAIEYECRRIEYCFGSPWMLPRTEYRIVFRLVEKETFEMKKLRELDAEYFREDSAKNRSGNEERKEQRDYIH